MPLNRFRALSAALFLSGLIAFTGCDSGDPIDAPKPADVAGTYGFTELTFQPTAAGVAPANVLDSLDALNTDLRLSSGGNFILSYQFKGAQEFFLSGDFDVSASTVKIKGDRNDRGEFNKLLLDNEFTLRRSETASGVLTAEIQKSVNLAAYAPTKYAGLTSVPGTLRLRLVRR